VPDVQVAFSLTMYSGLYNLNRVYPMRGVVYRNDLVIHYATTFYTYEILGIGMAHGYSVCLTMVRECVLGGVCVGMQWQ